MILEIYERNINSKVEKLDENTIAATSSFLDLDHNIFFKMIIDLDSRKIRDAEARMLKVPYPRECNVALINVEKIEGLKIEQGLSRKVSSALGGNTGCTHLVELVMTAARLASNQIIAIDMGVAGWKDILLEDKQIRKRVGRFLRNSCVVFKE